IAPDTWDQAKLWIANADHDQVTEFDTERKKIVGRPFHVPDGPTTVGPMQDSVVVAGKQDKGILLRRYDRQRHRQIGTTFHDPHGIPSDLVATSVSSCSTRRRRTSRASTTSCRIPRTSTSTSPTRTTSSAGRSRR